MSRFTHLFAACLMLGAGIGSPAVAQTRIYECTDRNVGLSIEIYPAVIDDWFYSRVLINQLIIDEDTTVEVEDDYQEIRGYFGQNVSFRIENEYLLYFQGHSADFRLVEVCRVSVSSRTIN